MVTATATTAVASYQYTMGAAGNRKSVRELSGRTVTYGYDDVYRLTLETISGAAQQNGAIGYDYDAVGNRKTMTSTVAAIPPGLWNYDANDRITTDTYDDNGNTIADAGTQNAYDFENHLTQRGGVTIVYDGDGNRVGETVAGVTTNYLVDNENPTGYAQVVEELQGGAVVRSYTWGHWLISATQKIDSAWQTSYYGYDGHGSVRFLTNTNGAVTDTYGYDAFGNLISSTGNTPNNYLFAGEQFDPALNLYYNRARYLDVRTGRFWGMDSYEGDPQSPASVHKYLYAANNPIDRIDPSGRESIAEVALVTAVVMTLALQSVTFLTFLNNTAAANESIDGFIVSGRFDVQALGGLGGGGVDILWDFHTSSLWVAGTLEAGISPLAVYKPTSKTAWSLTGGPVFGMTRPSEMSGGSTSLVLPLKSVHLFPGLLGGVPKIKGMMQQLAKNSKDQNVRWSHWVMALGVSTSGPSFLEFGPRQNFFAEVVGSTGDFHKVFQLDHSLELLAPLIDVMKTFSTTEGFASGFEQFASTMERIGVE